MSTLNKVCTSCGYDAKQVFSYSANGEYFAWSCNICGAGKITKTLGLSSYKVRDNRISTAQRFESLAVKLADRLSIEIPSTEGYSPAREHRLREAYFDSLAVGRKLREMPVPRR